MDQLGTQIDRGVPSATEEYERILERCRSECDKRNVGMEASQVDDKADGILSKAQAMHQRGEIGPRRLRFIEHEVGLMKKAANSGESYVEPVARLREFKQAGKSMKVKSVLFDGEIAVIVSPRDAGMAGDLTPYTPDELMLMIQHRLYEGAPTINAIKRVFDGELVAVGGGGV